MKIEGRTTHRIPRFLRKAEDVSRAVINGQRGYDGEKKCNSVQQVNSEGYTKTDPQDTIPEDPPGLSCDFERDLDNRIR